MEEKSGIPVPPGALAVPAKAARTPEAGRRYDVDGKDRLLLPLAWAVGLLFVELLCITPWSWGLAAPAAVAAWYAAALWYRGLEGFAGRESLLLFGAVCLLALTYPLFSNRWLRTWNACALPALAAVQLFAWSGAAGRPWSSPAMLWERALLLLEGLFSLGAPLQTAASLKKCAHRRVLYVLGALAACVPLLLCAADLLGQADPLFRYVTGGMLIWLREHAAGGALRLLLALCLAPFLFALLYTLRRPRRWRERPASGQPVALDPAAPVTVLCAMDALYLFFLAVQSAALFGGERYLAQTGVSYAQYARSGFFQLVFVAALNLTLVLLCLQLCRRAGRGWRAVRVLAAALVGMSWVLLASAAWRMSLYVAEYGLSFKRLLTYWGMIMLGVFFAAALLKIRREGFSFFRVFFAAGLAGWLVLNLCNPDYLVSRYNVGLYLRGETRVMDVSYLAGLSYGALGPLERLPGDTPAGAGRTLEEVLALRRAQAALEAGDWRTWSVSAQLAAGG